MTSFKGQWWIHVPVMSVIIMEYMVTITYICCIGIIVIQCSVLLNLMVDRHMHTNIAKSSSHPPTQILSRDSLGRPANHKLCMTPTWLHWMLSLSRPAPDDPPVCSRTSQRTQRGLKFTTSAPLWKEDASLLLFHFAQTNTYGGSVFFFPSAIHSFLPALWRH